MPSGDVQDIGAQPSAVDFYQSWLLLHGITATDNGVWIDFRGFRSISVEVVATAATFSAIVQLRGSNATEKPANTAHGQQIGGDMSDEGAYVFEAPFRWIKAYCPTYTSGTIDARGHATNK